MPGRSACIFFRLESYLFLKDAYIFNNFYFGFLGGLNGKKFKN